MRIVNGQQQEEEQEEEQQEELEDDFEDLESEDGEEEQEEPEPEDAEDEQAETVEDQPSTPFVAEAGEDEDDANLKNLLSPESYASMRRVMAREMRVQMQAMTASNIHVTAAAAQSPELFRVYGSKIQHNLAQLEPALRSKPEAVNIAIAGLFIEEARSKGAGHALSKLAALVGQKPIQQEAKPPKKAIPPSQRPPSAASGNTRGASVSREEGRIKLMMENYGLSRAEAANALVDEGVIR